MKFIWLWTVLWNILPLCNSSTAQKYITINVTSKDDLAIKCSIINSDQLAALHLIQLERASGSTFDKVITIWNNNSRSQIDWKDEDLKNRATANGSIEEEELRLFIDRVQCSTDFTEYRCYMAGILNPTQNNVPEINDTVTWSYSDTCTSTPKPQITTSKMPETTPRPGNAFSSTPQPRTTRASGNIGNADKDKRSSGTTLHISITGVETSQYTALLNALFWIPVWIIVKLNTDSA